MRVAVMLLASLPLAGQPDHPCIFQLIFHTYTLILHISDRNIVDFA